MRTTDANDLPALLGLRKETVRQPFEAGGDVLPRAIDATADATAERGA
jgi:hypothetical protein